MDISFLSTPVEYLKGVGPARADTLKKELKIFTFGELLSFFPFRYVDRSKIFRISEIRDDAAYIQVKAKITQVTTVGVHRARRLIATATDGSGEIDLVWFQGIKWVEDMLTRGREFIVFGKPAWFKGRINIAHPELESPEEISTGLNNSIRPFYSSTEGLKKKGLDSKGISNLLKPSYSLKSLMFLKICPREFLGI